MHKSRIYIQNNEISFVNNFKIQLTNIIQFLSTIYNILGLKISTINKFSCNLIYNLQNPSIVIDSYIQKLQNTKKIKKIQAMALYIAGIHLSCILHGEWVDPHEEVKAEQAKLGACGWETSA